MRDHTDTRARRGRLSRRSLIALALVALAASVLSEHAGTAGARRDALELIGVTAPSAPLGVTVQGGNKEVTVRWAAPASTGDSPITTYTVRVAGPAGETVTTVGGNTLVAVVSGLTNGTAYTATVAATNAVGIGPRAVANLIGSKGGYWFTASDGGIFAFGDARFLGSMGGTALKRPVVGIAAHPAAEGYWLVASDGGIFSFGAASFFGGMGGESLNKPIVTMAPTPSGQGYWLVASDGGIFDFGDAGFHGSTGNLVLNKPIVGMAPTATGRGYWLVASDGGIFSFGDASYLGSTGDFALNQPIVGMAVTRTGRGYWLVARDGGIFSFGDAAFYGSTGDIRLSKPIVGMAPSPSGKGYWFVASDGGIFSYGDAPFLGSTGDLRLNRPVVGMAVASGGTKVIPLTFPGRPRNVAAVSAPGSIKVSWDAPLDDGGCAIVEYAVTAVLDGSTVATKTTSGTARTVTFTGLESGRSYRFTVTARNCLGSGLFTPANNDVPLRYFTPGDPSGP